MLGSIIVAIDNGYAEAGKTDTHTHNFKAVPPLCQATGTGRMFGWTVEEGFPEKAVFESCPQQWRWDPQK